MASGGAVPPQPPRDVTDADQADQVDAARDWLRSHGIDAPEPERLASSRRRAGSRPAASTAAPRRVEDDAQGDGAGNPDGAVEIEGAVGDVAASREARSGSRGTTRRGSGRARRPERDARGERAEREGRSAPAEDGAGTEGGRRAGRVVDARADPDADPEEIARTIVLRKLAAQARTRAELERALTAKAVPEEAGRAVLDRMGEVGLVDDAAFARDWVTSRQQRRHLSRTALRRELQTKGVDREVIDDALVAVDGADEHRAALDLARRRAGSMGGLPREVAYRRLGGVLARRGFSPGVTTQVLTEVLGGWTEE